ncbi:MAG: hypothetical protein JSW52_02230 [Candidatus Coatesbacteria bacterium]|nr:MAG: hypothetical protein JSW52_02230 [Candidatus Coatesbacteria bacterium]
MSLFVSVTFYSSLSEGVSAPNGAENVIENSALKIIVDADGSEGRPGEVSELYFKKFSATTNLAEKIYGGVQAGEYIPAPGTLQKIDDKTLRFNSNYLLKNGDQLPLATVITYRLEGNCLNVRFDFTANGEVELPNGLEADFDLTSYDGLRGFTNGARDFLYEFDASGGGKSGGNYFLNQRLVSRGEPGSVTFVVRNPFESNVRVADTSGSGGYFTFVFFDHEEPILNLPGPDYHSVLPAGYTFHREVEIRYEGDIGDDTPTDPRTAVYFSPHREGADGTIMFLWDELPSPPQPRLDEWNFVYASNDNDTPLAEAVRTLEEHPAVKYVWLITTDYIGHKNYQDYYVDDVPDPTWANYHSTARILDWAPSEWKVWAKKIEDNDPSYEWMSRVALGNHGYHHTTSLEDLSGHEFIFYDEERDTALYNMITQDMNGSGLDNSKSTYCVRFPGLKYTYSTLRSITAHGLKFLCDGKRYETHHFSHYVFPEGEVWGINTSWWSDYKHDWPDGGRPFSFIQYTLDRKKPTLFGGHFLGTWLTEYPESVERFDNFLDRIETEYPDAVWELPQDFVPFVEEMCALEDYSAQIGCGNGKGVTDYTFSFTGAVSSGETIIFEDSSYFDVDRVWVDGQSVRLNEGEGYSYVILPALPDGTHSVRYRIEPGEGFDYVPKFLDAYAFPNPANSSVSFRAVFDEPLHRLRIEVYNVAGELIWKTDNFDIDPATYTYDVFWDLSANNAGKIANGVYICVWTAELSGLTASDVFKLAVVK